jgi:Amt family ammonium transporter
MFMSNWKQVCAKSLSFGAGVALLASPAAAEVSPETAYVFNSFLFLVCGFLVMFMAAGFAMLESGMVRSKNVATICFKNISLFSIAGLMYWLVGYNLMYGIEEGGYIGELFSVWSADDSAIMGETPNFEGGYAAGSDWFFQMVFCATTASIVSGTIAERMKLWPFLIFTLFLTGFIYPIVGSWEWGTGFLDAMGFSDFAGSTLVHSTGGWAALVGAIILGARTGKYGPNGQVNPMPGSNMTLATLGTFILWLGWFGFNGGSQLALGSGADAAAISNIFINTNMAAAGGVVVAGLVSQALYGKVDLTMALNGAIGGLVSITAEPLTPSIGSAVFIGGIGGLLVVLAVPLLDKLKIDDVVGAIPAHLVCGIWGTMIVPLTNSDASYGVQAIGVVSVGAFTVIASGLLWSLLKVTIGIRVDEEEELLGLDKSELGIEAYPEFSR